MNSDGSLSLVLIKNIVGKLKLTFTGTRVYQKDRVAVFQITFQANADQETGQNLIAKVSLQMEGEMLYSLKNNIFALKGFSGQISIPTNTAENVQMIIKGTIALKEETQIK